MLCYSVQKGFPFTAYGEMLLLVTQGVLPHASAADAVAAVRCTVAAAR